MLNADGLAIVVFDADVTAWDKKEGERLKKLREQYSNNKRVILCGSMPSIEFWFLIHFVNTCKSFGTSRAVIAELIRHIPQFEKSDSFLASRKWVELLCKDGKLHNAYSWAKSIGTGGDSYSNFWKALDYWGLHV